MNRRNSAVTEGLSTPTKGSGTGISFETMPAMKDATEYDLKVTMSAMHDVGQLQVSPKCAGFVCSIPNVVKFREISHFKLITIS